MRDLDEKFFKRRDEQVRQLKQLQRSADQTEARALNKTMEAVGAVGRESSGNQELDN